MEANTQTEQKSLLATLPPGKARPASLGSFSGVRPG